MLIPCRRLIASSALLLFIVPAHAKAAHETVNNCNGVYQNTPCPAGERQETLALQGSIVYRSITRQTVNNESSARARLAAPDLNTAGAGSAKPAPALSVLKRKDVGDLAREAAHLRAGIAQTVNKQGLDDTDRQLTRLWVALTALCRSDIVVPNTPDDKRCDKAMKDTVIAQQKFRQLPQ